MTADEQAAQLDEDTRQAEELAAESNQAAASAATTAGGTAAHERFVAVLRQQKANWQQDGKGIRGDATPVTDASANLNFPSGEVFRRPQVDIPDAQ